MTTPPSSARAARDARLCGELGELRHEVRILDSQELLIDEIRFADSSLVAFAIRNQFEELIDQQVGVQVLDVLAELAGAHLGHQNVVFLCVADRYSGFSELQGTHDIVITRGNNDVGFGDLVHQLMQRGYWFGNQVVGR